MYLGASMHASSFSLLILVVIGSCVSLLLFQGGFLLIKPVMQRRSSCSDVASGGKFCWLPAQFNRSIWLIIDGLRFDFIVPLHGAADSAGEERGGGGTRTFSTGQMPKIASMLKNHPDGTRLYRLLSDAPTTTFQRLKALTTGSIPAFIEAGKNFGADTILEDNLIQQIYDARKNATILGDDTWDRLFPERFQRSFTLPSFDIKDLDTVDNMVISSVRAEIERLDWTLLIAHSLGVDHCGHRYGVEHQEMTRKLREMDELISNISAWMQEDTLLFVLGDHGMTLTGDHGGDSLDEVETALYVFTKRNDVFPPLLPSKVSDAPTIHQVDIVPTLCLLLDLPIPFSNLGSRVESLIPGDLLVQATKLNTAQMIRYAQEYANSGATPEAEQRLRLALRDFDRVNSDENLEFNRELMQRLQGIFRSSLNQLDEQRVLLGLLSLFDVALVLVNTLLTRINSQKASLHLPTLLFRSALLLLQLSVCFTPSGNAVESASSIRLYLLVALFTSIGYHFVQLVVNMVRMAGNNLAKSSWNVYFVLALFHSFSYLSNSYILYEADLALFALLLALVMIGAGELRANRLPKRGFLTNILENSSWQRLLASYAICAVCLRAGTIFRTCREEQVDCDPTAVWTGKGVESEMVTLRGKRRAMATGMAIVGLSLLIHFLNASHRVGGAMKANSSGILFRLLCWLAVGAVAVHWVCEFMPPQHQLFVTIGMRSAVCAYALSAVLLAWAILTSGDTSQRLRQVATLLTIPLSMILGVFLAPSFALLCIATELVPFPTADPLTRGFLANALRSYSFYALGHQATLGSIPWEAAFVGVPGNFPVKAIPAILVLMHLYGAQVVITISLCSRNDNDDIPHSSLAFLLPKLLGCCLAGFVHRKHLFFIKVFAPKFIFEAVAFLVDCLCILLVSIYLCLRPKVMSD